MSSPEVQAGVGTGGVDAPSRSSAFAGTADRVSLVSAYVFIACIVVGLVGAFVGLNASSLWVDEIYSSWVVAGHQGFGGFAARALTDMHPPIYYTLLWGYSRLFGDGDVALRALSAIFAVGAVLIYLAGTRGAFSGMARLFSGAIAASSAFWFYQSQNIRDYSLLLCISGAILAVGLRMIRTEDETRRPRTLAVAFVLLTVVGSLVHFYIAFLSLAACVVLFVLAPRRRVLMALTAISVIVVVGLYVKLVIVPHSQWLTNASWIKNNLHWYRQNLASAAFLTFSKFELLALLICAGCVVPAVLALGAGAAQANAGRLSQRLFEANRPLVFATAVVIVMFFGAVASCFLLEPSLTDRNFLVCSPFIWAACAGLYDAGVARIGRTPRLAATGALALLAILSATIVLHRPRQRNEDFRDSAAMVSSLQACRGQPIPVLSDSRAGLKPGFDQVLTGAYYDHYLPAGDPVVVLPAIRVETGWLSPGVDTLLRQRLAAGGCPVLAWSVHNEIGPAEAKQVAQDMSSRFGRRVAVTTFYAQPFRLGHGKPTPSAYVFSAG